MEGLGVSSRGFTSHLRQGSTWPRAFARPSCVTTHGRLVHGGSWRTCWLWPHSSSATQWRSSSWWKPTILLFMLSTLKDPNNMARAPRSGEPRYFVKLIAAGTVPADEL